MVLSMEIVLTHPLGELYRWNSHSTTTTTKKNHTTFCVKKQFLLYQQRLITPSEVDRGKMADQEFFQTGEQNQ